MGLDAGVDALAYHRNRSGPCQQFRNRELSGSNHGRSVPNHVLAIAAGCDRGMSHAPANARRRVLARSSRERLSFGEPLALTPGAAMTEWTTRTSPLPHSRALWLRKTYWRLQDSRPRASARSRRKSSARANWP